jgi:hypothetical protein
MSPGPIRGTLKRFFFFEFSRIYSKKCSFSGVRDTAEKYPTGVRDTAEKYPAGVSDTAEAYFISLKRDCGVRDTAEKYPTGVSDTAEKYPAGVSDTGERFKIRISSRNFEKKNRNRLRMPQMGPEEAVLMKKSNFKNLVTLSL